MKQLPAILLIGAALLSCTNKQATAAPQQEQADTATVANQHIEAIYEPEDSVQIEKWLNMQHNDTNIPLFYARKFLGKPYKAHTLEGNEKETLVVNTRQVDCTTLVENVVALTVCKQQKKKTFQDFLRVLRDLRYRGGELKDYTSRLHYFTEWIIDNTKKGYVKEVGGSQSLFSNVQTVSASYMSNHPEAYEALKRNPSYLPEIRDMEQSITGKMFRYIPTEKVQDSQELREYVKDGDIIAITCEKPGLEIAHLGFAVWQKDGLHLLNASSMKQNMKVVEETLTLYRYLQKNPTDTGIRVIRIQP